MTWVDPPTIGNRWAEEAERLRRRREAEEQAPEPDESDGDLTPATV